MRTSIGGKSARYCIISCAVLTTSLFISVCVSSSFSSPTALTANPPSSNIFFTIACPSSTGFPRVAIARPLPPLISCLPPICTRVTVLRSPGSNRTAVPAGISRRSFWWNARILSNDKERFVSKNGKCDPTFHHRPPLAFTLPQTRKKIKYTDLDGTIPFICNFHFPPPTAFVDLDGGFQANNRSR
jgi:hypothetical protein